MTMVTMPARRWSDDVDEAPPCLPVVIVSSRDHAPVPRIAAVARLTKVAEAAGWSVRATYALAAVPDRFYLNGKVARAAHMLASVALRLARGAARAWAVWTNQDDAGWRFDVAYIGPTRHGARSFATELGATP